MFGVSSNLKQLLERRVDFAPILSESANNFP